VAKLSSKGLMGIALVLSFVTAVLVYNLLSRSVPKPAVVEGATVVTARVDIAAKTRITAAMVQESRVPAEYIQAGAFRDLPRVVGMVTSEMIVGGEQVLERRLFTDGKQVGFTGVIPAGKRALTVGVSDITGVAGLVKAGDAVDAIVTFDQQVVGDNVSQILLQNILVLAVNRESEVPKDRDPKKEAAKDAGVVKMTTVTLAVSPEEAAQIAMAEDKGKLRFALRPYLPETGVASKQVVTPTSIVGLHKSPLQTSKEPPTTASPAAPAAPATGTGAKSLTGIPVIRGTKVE